MESTFDNVADAVEESDEQTLMDDLNGEIICDVDETVAESDIGGLDNVDIVNQMYETLLGPDHGGRTWSVDVIGRIYMGDDRSHVVCLTDSETGESATVLVVIDKTEDN